MSDVPNNKTHVRIRMAYAVDVRGEVDVRGWRYGDADEQPDDDELAEFCGESLRGAVSRGWLEAWVPRPLSDEPTIECDVIPDPAP